MSEAHWKVKQVGEHIRRHFMADNTTLGRRLMILNDHEPNDVLPEAAARIAELEADYAKAEELTARAHAVAKRAMERIAELEVEVARLNEALQVQIYDETEHLALAHPRIAELEAERDRLQEALRLKYGDVLAERDSLKLSLGEAIGHFVEIIVSVFVGCLIIIGLVLAGWMITHVSR